VTRLLRALVPLTILALMAAIVAGLIAAAFWLVSP